MRCSWGVFVWLTVVFGFGAVAAYAAVHRDTLARELQRSALFEVTAVPEPTTLLLLGAGLSAVAAGGRRMRR